jgi:hypothetical protein
VTLTPGQGGLGYPAASATGLGLIAASPAGASSPKTEVTRLQCTP